MSSKRLLGRLGSVAAVSLALCGCHEDPGRFDVELDLPDDASGWIWLTVAADDGGADGRRVGPVRVTTNLVIDLPAIPHQRRWRLFGEHRNSAWLNAPVTHRAETESFEFRPGDNLRLFARFEPVQTPETGPAPPGPELSKVEHRRRPWGASEGVGDVVSGEAGAVSAAALVVAYDGPEVDGALELQRTTAGADGSFRLEVGTGLEAPSRIYVATSPDGVRLSDTSTKAGLQAGRVTRGRWTASFRGRRPGTDFPNPNRLTRQARAPVGLEDPTSGAREPSAETLTAAYGGTDVESQPIRVEHRPRWRRREFGLKPDISVGVAAAFDPARGITVLFLGIPRTEGGEQGQTWVWDGQEWTRINTQRRPTSVIAHRMAYHGGLRQVVLFGGSTAESRPLDELWGFDGQDWHPIEIEGETRPPPRGDPALAYDGGRNRLVVYGGCPDPSNVVDEPRIDCEVTPLEDTWELVDNRWVQRIAQSAPGPRAANALAYDPIRRRSYLTGFQERGETTVVWSWNGEAWRREPDLPTGRSSDPSLTWDGDNNRLLFWEGPLLGETEGLPNELFSFDGSRWSKIEVPAGARRPNIRLEAKLVFDPLRHETLLVGGSLFGDQRLWRFAGGEWRVSQSATEQIPTRQSFPTLSDMTAAYDERRQRWVAFGGWIPGEYVSDELWEFDGETWYRVPRQGTWPPPRFAAQSAYDGVTGSLVVTGGLLRLGRACRRRHLAMEWPGLATDPVDAHSAGARCDGL